MAVSKTALILAGALVLAPATFAEDMVVDASVITDFRPVIARIEASDTALARSRLQGVVTDLRVDEGDVVEADQVIARVVDAKISPQIDALSARIEALNSQIEQAERDLARNEELFSQGFFPKAKLDEQKTGLEVLRRTLTSTQAERRAVAVRQSEGSVRAPAAGRITAVNVVEGSVVSPSEVIATLATLDGVVRLSLPERHAATAAEGETVRLRLPARGNDVRIATIVKVYPELKNGAVIADAKVDGGIDALVGERVDVLAPVGERRAILIPDDYVDTRYGVDFVRVLVGDRYVEAPVTLASTRADENEQLEVLSGLKTGDRIQKPE